uniref:Uncharacterized protein n=1 Tax=Anguilla anguilla TaxID=7936 RepID=A0A0E9UZ65_ANGAN
MRIKKRKRRKPDRREEPFHQRGHAHQPHPIT